MESTCETDQVPDRHRDPTVTVRPAQQVKDATTEELGRLGWTLGEALVACMAWILSNPGAAASQLERFRPPKKHRGRPRKPSVKG